MAKDTENFTFDDDDFNFDFDMGDEGGFQSGKKQSGARKAITEFGGSFLSGIKKSLLDPANHRKLIAQNTPEGFTTVYDGAATGKRAVTDIYQRSKDSFFKELEDISGDVKSLDKKFGKHLPEGIRNRLLDAAEATSKRTYADPNGEEALTGGLDSILANVAKSQNASTIINKDTQERTANRIVAGQATTTSAVLASTQLLSKLVGGSDRLFSVGMAQAQLQRKNIELTFKQTIVQRQILETLQQTQKMQQAAFEALIKNTGLPEAVKTTLWENSNLAIRNKIVGKLTNKATARIGDVFNRINTRLQERGSSMAGEAGNVISQMLSMGSLVADMGGMMGSRYNTAGEFAGEAGMNLLQRYIRNKIGDRFKKDPRFKVYGDAIQNLLMTAPGKYNQAMRDWGGNRLQRWGSSLGIDDILAEDSSKNVTVRRKTTDKLDQAAAFNRHTQLALTEIIPGWLGKISHTLEKIQTGDADVAEQRYDYDRGGFTSVDNLKQRAMGQMFKKSDRNWASGEAEKILKGLDAKKEIKGKDREILKRYIYQQANSGVGYVDPEALMNTEKSPLNAIDRKAAERIAAVLRNEHNFNYDAENAEEYDEEGNRRSNWFNNTNRNAQYQDRMLQANKGIESLRRVLPNSMGKTLELARTGNLDVLKETGVIKWDNATQEWQFDQDVYLEYMMGDRKPPNGGRPSNGGGRGNNSPPGGMGPTPSPINNLPPRIDLTRYDRSQPSDRGSPRDSFSGDTGGYSAFQTELLQAVENASSRQSVDISNKLLEAIRERLELGVASHNEAPNPADFTRRTKLFRRILDGGASGTKRLFKGAMNAQMKLATLPFRMFGGALRGGGSLITGVASAFGGAKDRVVSLPGLHDRVDQATGKVNKVAVKLKQQFDNAQGDLYVKGKDKVAIKWNDLQAGEYIDQATGKVIKSFKDITGAIIDKAGNVVVTADEYNEGLYAMVKGKPFSLVGGVLRSGFNIAKSVVGAALSVSAIPGRMVKLVGGFLLKELNPFKPKDVYVVGEDTPRLLGRVMSAGNYFSKSGKVIKSVQDIDGDVVDADGEVLLTVADIAKGLVDKNGKPFKSVLGKIASIITAPVRLAMGVGRLGLGAARAAYQTGKFAVKGLVGLAKFNLGVLKKGFSPIGAVARWLSKSKEAKPMEVIGGRAADTLDNIYQLLDQRLTKPKEPSWTDRDGSGKRDGSRDDQLASRKSSKEPTQEDHNKEANNDRKGILGVLMGVAGGIGALIGTVRSWFGNTFKLMGLLGKLRLAQGVASLTATAATAGGAIWGAMKKFGSKASGWIGKLGSKGKLAAGLLAGAGLATAGGIGKAVLNSNMFKMIGMGSLGLGALSFGSSSYGAQMVKGATSAISGADADQFRKNQISIDMGEDTDVEMPKEEKGTVTNGEGGPTLSERFMNGIGGSMLGELGAIGTAALAVPAWDRFKRSRVGTKILPASMTAPKPKAPLPTTLTGKALKFFMGTTKGRMLSAAALGAGGIGVRHGLFGNENAGTDLGTETKTSYLGTLGLGAAGGLGIYGYSKLKDVMANRQAAMAAANTGPQRSIPVAQSPYVNTQFKPVAAAPGAASVARLGVNPNVVPAVNRPIVGPMPAPASMTAPKPGFFKGAMGKLGKFGVGPLGVGLAALQAGSTEGSVWDKTKAFGKGVVENAAWSKGFELLTNKGARTAAKEAIKRVGANVITQGGRQAMMQGGKTLLQNVGRQVVMQGARTVLTYGATALAGIVGSPVILGALAVAAVGAAAYVGYKYFFAKDKNAVIRFRMAQYGIKIGDESKVKIISQLENMCKKNIKISGKTAEFKSNLESDAVLKLFGIQPNDKEAVDKFITWFNNRFKPLFLNNVAIYQNMTKTVDLEKADTLPKEQKIEYVNAIATVVGNPYDTMISPFVGDKKLKFDADDVKSELKRCLRMLSHEKDSASKKQSDVKDKQLKDQADKSSAWETAKKVLTAPARAGAWVGSKVWGGVKALASFNYDLAKNVLTGNWKGAGQVIKAGANAVYDGVSNAVASMTGDQKKWQLAVYEAFKKAGFSEQQSRIFTAEVGRENSYNPRYLFAGHADPHSGDNLGMISWQGKRKLQLVAWLQKINASGKSKILDSDGTMIPSIGALVAQTTFIKWELENTETKSGKLFLPYPNISYKDGVWILGKYYIRWRIEDPKYAAKGAANRDAFYNMLLKQLNAKDGDSGTNGASSDLSPSYKNGTDPLSQNIKNAAGSSGGGGSTGSASSPLDMMMQSAKAGAGVSGGVSVNQNFYAGQKDLTAVAVVPIMGIPATHRAVKAATFATQKAEPASKGYCARYVANALQAGGYKFDRQPSAYMYASKGILERAGFKRIQNNGKYQIGDVMVWPAHGGKGGGGVHGHIQIFNGKNWVSDFIQRSVIPGKYYANSTPSLWRDSTLLGKVVQGEVANANTAKPATDTNVATKNDTTAKAEPAAKATPTPQASSVANSTQTNATVAPAAPVSPAEVISASTTTTSSDSVVTATQQRQQEIQTQSNQDMLNIQSEQLAVQKAMLDALVEIKDTMKANKETENNSPAEQPQANNQPDLAALAGLFKKPQPTKRTPISMGLKLT